MGILVDPLMAKNDGLTMRSYCPYRYRDLKQRYQATGRLIFQAFQRGGRVINLLLPLEGIKVVPFQKWVFEEVLPSIRQTGSYSLAASQSVDLFSPSRGCLENVRLGMA